MAPITLTKPQFLKKRPKGSYQSYLNYIKAARDKPPLQAPRNIPKAPPLPTLASLLGSIQIETPAQIEARANRLTSQGISAQQKLIRDEAAQMREEAMARMQAMAAAGRAAAQMNAGLFGMVGGEYNAAAGELRGLATGGAGEVAAMTAADVANVNQGLAAVGAPGVTQGGPGTAGMAGPGQAGVESYLGGELPGQALGTAGQAATFGLAGLVSSQNLRATQEAQASLRQATYEIDKNRAAAIKELAAGRTQTAAEYISRFQEAQRQQIGLASGLIQQRAALQEQGWKQGMTEKEYNTRQAQWRKTFLENQKQQAVENKLAVTELAMKKQGLQADLSQVDAARSMAVGHVVDKAGRTIPGPDGGPIPWQNLLRGTKTSSGRTLTPGQKVELIQDAQELVENGFYGYKVVGGEIKDGKRVGGKRVPATEAPGFDPNNPATYGGGAQDYGTALRKLMRLNLSKVEAQSMLDELYERGDLGRPVFSTYEQKILKKRMGASEYNKQMKRITRLLSKGPDMQANADWIIDKMLRGQPIPRLLPYGNSRNW